jgi:hypothetical protein
MRAAPIQPPGQKPCRKIASRVNSEHEGAWRQLRPMIEESV